MRQQTTANILRISIIILLIILIGVVSYSSFLKKAEQPQQIPSNTVTKKQQEIKQSKIITSSTTNELYSGITDSGFITFASTVIDKRCPFYKPDGVTYKECLATWIDELSKPLMVEQIDEVHAYCEVFSKKYADNISFEQSELFTKCVIYKLQP
jgi:hypothetical protein